MLIKLDDETTINTDYIIAVYKKHETKDRAHVVFARMIDGSLLELRRHGENNRKEADEFYLNVIEQHNRDRLVLDSIASQNKNQSN